MAYDNHIEDDEFHPNPTVAAFYADRNAMYFAAKTYTHAIVRLEAIADRSCKEQIKLDDLRELRDAVLQRIKDTDPNENPED